MEMGLQLFGSFLSPFLNIKMVLDSLNLMGGLLVRNMVLKSSARQASEGSLICLTVMPSGPGAEFFHPNLALVTSAALIGLDRSTFFGKVVWLDRCFRLAREDSREMVFDYVQRRVGVVIEERFAVQD